MNTSMLNSRVGVRAYVPTSATASSVEFDEHMMHVHLADGRIISVPLIWFPLLHNATQSQLRNYEISPAGIGIHWPELDEDLSIAGLMGGVDLLAA